MRVNDTVKTIETLSRKEFIADKANKSLRRVSAPGVITGILGKCNERYLVIHDGETIPAVYIREELVPEPNAYWKVTYSQGGFTLFTEVLTHRDALELCNELHEEGVKSATVEGPFYSDKELTEGQLPSRSLFDHLKDGD
jgi:hypothetical protein